MVRDGELEDQMDFGALLEYVAYDLRSNTTFRLNPFAVKILDSLQSPKKFVELINSGKEQPFEQERLRDFVIQLLNQGIIEIQ